MRRSALALIALMAATPLFAASGDDYPSKSVRVIVPVLPGGATDVVARIVSAKLSETLGKPFVIDNRGGAGGITGSDIVAKSAPDGHTLLFAYAGHTIVPFIYSKVPYDVYRDFAPITMAASQPLLLAINAGVGVNTVEELIAAAKARPDQFNAALPTPSGAAALVVEMFKVATGTKITSVPFKGGGPALTALLSNEVQLMFTTPPVAIPQLKNGRLRILATSSRQRLPYLPDVRTLAESGLRDFEVEPWQGLLAPAGTPAGVIDKLHRQVQIAIQQPDVKEKLAAAGCDPAGTSPREFAKKIARELDVNGKVIKLIGMRAE